MSKNITIDPITRLEGHGKIDLFLDDAGNIDRAFFQVPELRGFESFVEGRRSEDMPQITSRICGVCPTAHHMASAKTLDALYGVEPPPAAETIRRVFYDLFMVEDHLLHFFFLGGPDFIVGPSAPKAARNILGVVEKVGPEVSRQLIDMRGRIRSLMAAIGGKPIHPVLGLPGGVAKAVTEEMRAELKTVAADAVEFVQFSLKAFDDIVLGNKEYVDLITSDAYSHATYYMGMVDKHNLVDFYGGKVRVVSPEGVEIERFTAPEYTRVIAEHVEPWSYIKFPYLRKIGWKGFVDGKGSGIYRVAPLARLNAADGMSTPLAQQVYEKMYKTLGGKPAHSTLANHWARLIEALYAAEELVTLAGRKELTSPEIRNTNLKTPREGVGVIEAPRGTLIHHYTTDERGLMKSANLIVATLGNSAAINMSVEKAAKALVHQGHVDDGLLNKVEMAFRAYDPCLGCATHCLPGKMPLSVNLRKSNGDPLATVVREEGGRQRVC
jgi:F420-non-reducing hydrogenase large subunit